MTPYRDQKPAARSNWIVVWARRVARARRDTMVWHMLSDYRWFRRLVGGRWECWWLDVVHSACWFHEPVRVPALGRGCPVIETYEVLE